MKSAMPNNYFSEETLSHLKPQQGLPERYQRRALDVTLACKLTHVYRKYHLAMLHRELAFSEERTTYQQAERSADIMNQITIFHYSPSDFLHTQDESIEERCRCAAVVSAREDRLQDVLHGISRTKLDECQKNSAEWQTTENVYHVDA